MTVLVLAASAVAVAALSGVAWLLQRGRPRARIAGPQEALDEAEAALAGFVAVAAIVADDGKAALVTGEQGRVAVLKRHGARLAAREIGWEQIRATPGGIVVETGERRFGPVPLAGVDALDVRRATAGDRPSAATALARQLTAV